MPTPEQRARQNIDKLLQAAGWVVQDRRDLNLGAGLGVAVREFPLSTGPADYLLFVQRKAIGVVEAKPEGTTLSGVEAQSARYSIGLGATPLHWHSPLPFLYESTGVETFFTDGLDPEPRSQRVFAFHQPETLLRWVREPATLRGRLRALPPLITHGLWPAQIEAIANLEASLAANRPRALIQMATGSGKTFTAVSSVYRLIKHAKAQRVLFLVDRRNLGKQALNEFRQYVTPDDGRKFSELYNVQHMQSNLLDPVSQVCITTIQRLYSMLRGEAEFDPALEEQSLWEVGAGLERQPPRAVAYNRSLPPEYFDVIFVDECHRSIYTLWRQVLEYFDAFLNGLTATPALQTLAFFNRNLVMEYSRQRAIADGVNVDGVVYQIRTRITEEGSTVEAGNVVKRRERRTRAERWEQLDEDLSYDAGQLDRAVVAEDQIRTVVRAWRDRLFTEIFPGRSHVPKTIVFAKDDSHAEAIVRIVREEFDKGNEFCQKITYRVTGVSTDDLISAFRNSYHPRIAVTVDMISTGTDIKPVECLLFMRLVKSRTLFEQMVGRGTRVIDANDLLAVTPDAGHKDHFVIVDAVGIVDQPKLDPEPLERQPSLSFARLLERMALGVVDEDTLSSLAGRLARLRGRLSEQDAYRVAAAGGGLSLGDIVHRLLDAIDPDAAGRRAEEVGIDVDRAAAELMEEAARLFDSAELRQTLLDIQARDEQTVDVVSLDQIREARFGDDATAQALATVSSFQQFIREHRDQIAALEIIYGQPYGQRRLHAQQLAELAEQMRLPPHAWTTESLWRAYAQLERDRVRGVRTPRVLTDLVSLVRHAVQLDDELAPYPEQVQRRYSEWLAGQEQAGRTFTPEQLWWLDRIAEHIGVNLELAPEDLDYGEFFNRGGRLGALRALGAEWRALVDQMNEALAAV
jgi:type I restriction enzyme R subunit